MNTRTGGWSEQEVRNLLASGHFGYQRIELPYGLSTGGRDRSPTARAIFPEDMSGKSVLDIGSKLGYFCFEAARRGASRVVGVEIDPQAVRRARQLADCLGLDVSFETLDIETEPIPEHFDYVLCLNVLHHMRNPVSLLDKLTAITKERLILEVAGFSWHDRRKAGISLYRSALLKRSPVIWVTPNSSASTDTQHTFLSPAALVNLLTRKRRNFARVRLQSSPQKRRFIAIAEKRRIQNLMVVAGPPESGVSDLVRQIELDRAPEVSARAGIRAGEWTYVRASELDSLTEPVIDNLVLEYDITRPFFRTAQTHERDDALDLVRQARNVQFLTVWCPPDRLVERMRNQRFPWWKTRRRRHVVGRHAKLLREYADLRCVIDHYRRWFAFCTSVPPGDGSNHAIVDMEDGIKFLSVSDWEARAAAFEAGSSQ